MKLYWLALGILAVWRITHLLNSEDGPREILARFRQVLGNGFWGELLDCFYCLSLWIAAPFAWWLGEDWKERLLLWPALSGASILLERVSKQPDRRSTEYHELSKEDYDVLLRQSQGDTEDAHIH